MALKGAALGEDSFDRVITEDTDAYKEDGTPLLIYRRKALPDTACRSAYKELRKINSPPTNRGVAAVGDMPRPLKQDGTRSNTNHLTPSHYPQIKSMSSAIIGFFDRYARTPFCRQTAFNLNDPKAFSRVYPLIRSADKVFAQELPERYEAQRAIVEKTHPDFYISGTVFTTVTVNKNFPTRVHKDAGDYAPGFGVLTVLRAGKYTGGYFCYPEYRLAVDMGSGDVLLSDVHTWHGNTPIKGVPGQYERISCVLYYRARMFECGSAEEEYNRAKRRKRGDPLHEKELPGYE
jgi:hypothetical protein